LHSNTYTTASAGFDRGFDAFADLGGFDDTSDLETMQSIKTRPSDSDTSDPDWRSAAREVTDRLGIRRPAERLIKPIKRHDLIEVDPRADALELFDITLDWLDDQIGATFIWLQLACTYLPYLPLERYRSDHLMRAKIYERWQALTSRPYDLFKQEVADLHDLYYCEARYVDERLKGFIDTLKSRSQQQLCSRLITANSSVTVRSQVMHR
jgi:hypothetical protein